jgi:hypothetical protein
VAGVLRNTRAAGRARRPSLRRVLAVLVGLFLLVLPAAGQLQLGDFNSNLNGTVSTGYNGDYGNQISSAHSLDFGGTGTLSGFYYNPNFLSYTVSPYLNQARDNSSYQSISNASGVDFESSIFGGSHFPGSISYAKAYNSEGSIGIPGVANYTTHGDSDTFGVSWAAMVPGLPSLAANFQMGSNQYSIYGSNDTGSSDSHSFGLRSGYTVKGFNLGAYFSDGSSHSDVPQVLQNSSQTETSTSSNHGYGFTVGHALPFNGSFSGNVNRSDVNSDFEGASYSGTIDTYIANAGFQPTNKLHVGVSTDYSDNFAGTLYQAIAGAGGVLPPPNLGEGTHSFELLGSTSYSILPNMQALGSADYREQSFLGENYAATTYSAGISYGRGLFGGNFNSVLSLNDSTVSNSSQNILGFNGSVNYNRRFEGWVMGGSFNYAQSVQTLVVTYMASQYNYSANVRRRWRRLSWSAGAGAGRTGLTEQAGTTSSNEAFNTSIVYSRWSLNGSYSKSSGQAIASGAGLIPTPIPPPILNSDLILYGGKSYGFGLGGAPMRRLTVTASFAKAITNANLEGTLSSSNTAQINTLFQYQFRKMYLTGGYSRLVQGFSTSGTPPENVSSFYIGVSRWFNFF